MTTPDRSVDEIVEELVNKVSHDIPNLIPTRDELDAMKKNILRELRQELTQTLKAERQRCEEMVEAERERILEMIGHLPYVSEDEYKKYKDGGIIKWVTLKEHFTSFNNPK